MSVRLRSTDKGYYGYDPEGNWTAESARQQQSDQDRRAREIASASNGEVAICATPAESPAMAALKMSVRAVLLVVAGALVLWCGFVFPKRYAEYRAAVKAAQEAERRNANLADALAFEKEMEAEEHRKRLEQQNAKSTQPQGVASGFGAEDASASGVVGMEDLINATADSGDDNVEIRGGSFADEAELEPYHIYGLDSDRKLPTYGTIIATVFPEGHQFKFRAVEAAPNGEYLLRLAFNSKEEATAYAQDLAGQGALLEYAGWVAVSWDEKSEYLDVRMSGGPYVKEVRGRVLVVGLPTNYTTPDFPYIAFCVTGWEKACIVRFKRAR